VNQHPRGEHGGDPRGGVPDLGPARRVGGLDEHVEQAGDAGAAGGQQERARGTAAGVVAALTIGDDGIEDADGQWPAAYGLDDAGAVLVRPDGYVGWRSRSMPADPTTTLRAALSHGKSLEAVSAGIVAAETSVTEVALSQRSKFSCSTYAMGHERPNYGVRAASALPPEATELLHYGKWRLGRK